MNVIATLHELRQYLGMEAGQDDARLVAALTAASAQIERAAGRRFMPRHAAITHSVDVRQPAQLSLKADLLELVSITSNDGTIFLPSAVTVDDGGGLHLRDGRIFTWIDSPRDALTVSGVWGWHPEPETAWRNTGDSVQNNPLTADSTSLGVFSATAADPDGLTPRFQVSHLLRIDDEYLRVLDILPDLFGDALVVERGVNGTTPASHANSAAIFRYAPPPDVVRLVIRWAGWLYREPDHIGLGDVPPDLEAALRALRRIRVR